MYIYQVYKNKKDLQNSIKDNKLHEDYYFAFNHSIYKMINDRDYVRVSYFIFDNDLMRKNIEKIADLKYQDGDVIKIQSRQG